MFSSSYSCLQIINISWSTFIETTKRVYNHNWIDFIIYKRPTLVILYGILKLGMFECCKQFSMGKNYTIKFSTNTQKFVQTKIFEN